MATCRRCGKTFDYKKREGVCPECCFYNRPDGTWQEDESWIKNYNYEDNSYKIEKSSYNDEDGEEKDTLGRYLLHKENRHASKEVDGSHSHLPDGTVIRGADPTGRKQKISNSNKREAVSKKKPKFSLFFIFIVIYWIFVILNMIFD